MRRKSSKARKPLRNNRVKRAISRKSLRRQIATQIRRQAETKEQKITAERYLLWGPTAAAFNTRNIFATSDILATISQGTGQGDRIGNKVSLVNFFFSFIVWARATNLGGPSLPIDLCMYVFSDKLNPTSQLSLNIQNSIAGITQPYFYEAGNATTGANLTITDQLLRVNGDRFTLHKKKIFKISTSTVANWSNNDYKASRKFKINLAKYMPKLVQWNDAGVLTSRQVWVMFLPVIANDDTSTVFANSDLVGIGFDYQVKWKDM
ncbi:putative capsid protein [Sewage-associated circular DNA virus-20]|uniref:Capsid protein n=1 Tax=Sewage-associated circular DNA virus-20 TaxID=1592087 RepID=A0A0B4UFX6_9VIRU|nr:putative capsid protein [Sewage-associated circular DNA virus-20]AJD07532.1 putative capsid protein [Sewage-associated circular DNA virus-20]